MSSLSIGSDGSQASSGKATALWVNPTQMNALPGERAHTAALVRSLPLRAKDTMLGYAME
jgi:hypothetical protein